MKTLVFAHLKSTMRMANTMKSIQRRFNKVSKRNPFWSSLVCFSEAIKDQKFSRQIIHRQFHKLVDNCEYENKDRKMIFSSLENL
jgi:hypothetical protein